MVKRILSSAAVTLALTLTPTLVFATPTRTVKKRAARTVRLARKSYHHHRRARIHRTRYSRRYYRHHSRRVVESSMIPSYRRGYVAETPPLMKVIPQRDGNFLLEPLTPPKKNTSTPLSESYNTSNDDWITSQIHKYYNTYEPWGFRELVLAMAKAYDHTPYCYGASLETSDATDCSGFVQFIYHQFKINLPRSSAEQAQVGKTVTRRMDFSKLLPGDLLFFRRHGHIGHTGIYLGGGKMIHASNPRTGVTITDIQNDPYYRNTFVVAKRVFVVQYPE